MKGREGRRSPRGRDETGGQGEASRADNLGKGSFYALPPARRTQAIRGNDEGRIGEEIGD